MSGLESKKSRELYIGDLMQSLLLDLMDGDADLEIQGSEISTCADQMQNHFLSNVYSAGLDIVVVEQWRVFDKDDESTWPPKREQYFVYLAADEQCAAMMQWRPEERGWFDWGHDITHWMPITLPSPPSSSETGSKKQ